MRFSIVTVVRNAAAQIGDTLQSVRLQTGVDVEHLVVDGASTDGTLDVIRQHGQHVARSVSEPDRGIYDAFNKGLALATGDVIAFLNAGDTYIGDEVLAGIQGQFASHDVDAVFGDVLMVGATDPRRVVRHYRSAYFTPERLAYGFMPAHPALFLKRSVYERVGGYDASYRQAGDFELCVRVFLKGRIPYMHVPKAMVRMLAGGISNRGLKSRFINTREIRRACRTNGVATNYLKLSLRFPIKALELLLKPQFKRRSK